MVLIVFRANYHELLNKRQRGIVDQTIASFWMTFLKRNLYFLLELALSTLGFCFEVLSEFYVDLLGLMPLNVNKLVVPSFPLSFLVLFHCHSWLLFEESQVSNYRNSNPFVMCTFS